MGSNISHQSRKDNHVTSFPFVFLFRSLTTIPRTDMFKITERALKTIWITKLPHPLVQAASVATFHQITIYMGKREACSIPVERHLSKARWLMANCLQTTTCFDLAWNSNQA